MMGRIKRMMVATAVAASGGLALAAPADAQEPNDVWVEVVLSGVDAPTVRDGIVVEFYETAGGTMVTPTCDEYDYDGSTRFVAQHNVGCDLPGQPGGTYALGLSGVPEGWTVYVECFDGGEITERLDDPGAEFATGGGYPADCTIWLRQAIVILDKTVVGTDTPAPSSDFTLEVFADGAQVATAVDPSNDICEGWDDADAGTACAVIGVEPGVITLGELPTTGYEFAGLECESIDPLENENPDEAFDDESATYDLLESDLYCTITNTYAEGQLIVTASVNNDDGGTAGVEDVSIEVYEDGVDAPVVAATACAADGSCLDEMLPIGDYVIGYTGPDGYTREITQSVTAPSTTTTSLPVIQEAMVTDDPDAEFTIENGGLVEIEVAIDDPAPEPTTTTTEPATTTTAFDAGAGTLPPTGASSETNMTIAVLAFALIAAGLALVGVRRRTA